MLGRSDAGLELALPVQPDFIIIGAMKCGTTSLHKFLDSHPDVYMPEGEVQLLTIDDIEQNPVFFPFIDEKWAYQDFEKKFSQYAKWYSTLYENAEPGQIKGEDAPSYLPSKKALERIAQYMPDTKVLVSLRDPVDRLYSQYWHWVRTFRATRSFEETIRFESTSFLQRSYYEEQLRYCYNLIPKEQVKVIIFEEFIKDRQKITQEIFSFLGLPDKPLALQTKHANKGKYPKSLKLALHRNRRLSYYYGNRYLGRIPGLPNPIVLQGADKWYNRVMYKINPLTHDCPAPAHPETRIFLSQLLHKRNEGLGRLLNRDLAEFWPSFKLGGKGG